jgi:hypothetical protein
MASAAHPARLDTLAREAAFKLKRSQEYKTSASILLADCKRRIDAGDTDACGLTWREYCRVCFPVHPPSYLDRLIDWDPDDSEDESQIDVLADAFDRAWRAFVTLAPARQREFLRCGVAYAMHPEGEESSATCEVSASPPHALDYQV